MPSNKTSIVIAAIFIVFLGAYTKDAKAQATKTITVPEDTNVVLVDSTHCEPIYNENTGSLYVPRCWKLKQEREKTAIERVTERTIENASTEVENSVYNVIDRVIRDMGEKIEKAGGNR